MSFVMCKMEWEVVLGKAITTRLITKAVNTTLQPLQDAAAIRQSKTAMQLKACLLHWGHLCYTAMRHNAQLVCDYNLVTDTGGSLYAVEDSQWRVRGQGKRGGARYLVFTVSNRRRA